MKCSLLLRVYTEGSQSCTVLLTLDVHSRILSEVSRFQLCCCLWCAFCISGSSLMRVCVNQILLFPRTGGKKKKEFWVEMQIWLEMTPKLSLLSAITFVTINLITTTLGWNQDILWHPYVWMKCWTLVCGANYTERWQKHKSKCFFSAIHSHVHYDMQVVFWGGRRSFIFWPCNLHWNFSAALIKKYWILCEINISWLLLLLLLLMDSLTTTAL